MNKVFISYSWDNEDHKIWVKKLANKLIESGIETLLDEYEIKIGDSFTQFMEKSIEESQYTIVVLTPDYKKKSTERKGGVGYEQQIISGEIMSLKERNKFIPILKNGEYDIGEKCAIPSHFKGIATIDFREDLKFEDSFEQLIRTILNKPKSLKPKLGKHPILENEISLNKITQKVLTLNLNDKLQFIDSKARVINLLNTISEYREQDVNYKLNITIVGLSELVIEYSLLRDKDELSDIEIERKNFLKDYLNHKFYIGNNNKYDYLEHAINLTIDYSLNKHQIVNLLDNLYLSIKELLEFYGKEKSRRNPTVTYFDVFNNDKGWVFKIDIDKNELDKLLSKFNTDKKELLTAFAGLDLFDLSNETIINQVIPRQAFSLTNSYFMKRIKIDDFKGYMGMNNWRIGLA